MLWYFVFFMDLSLEGDSLKLNEKCTLVLQHFLRITVKVPLANILAIFLAGWFLKFVFLALNSVDSTLRNGRLYILFKYSVWYCKTSLGLMLHLMSVAQNLNLNEWNINILYRDCEFPGAKHKRK